RSSKRWRAVQKQRRGNRGGSFVGTRSLSLGAGRSPAAGSGSRRTPAAPPSRRGRTAGGSPPQPSPRRSARRRSPEEAAGGGRRRRYRPGHRALQELRKAQPRAGLLTLKLPFVRGVRDGCPEYTGGVDVTWQSMALLALQELFLEDASLCTTHAQRVTLPPRDIQLAQQDRSFQHGLG
ncbi:hypothetical protein NXF25_002268, partial [Crotalus adamanteus]